MIPQSTNVRVRLLPKLRPRRLKPALTVGLGLAWALAATWLPGQARATEPLVKLTSFGPGKEPFINLVVHQMQDANLLDHVQFTVAPKPGSVTRPVSARYSRAYLIRNGFLNASTGGITVPVFGLYANYENSVQMVFTFVDGTTQTEDLALTSPAYASGVYNHPAIVKQARTADTTLSYDFLELKSYINPHSPTIIDTDGEIRWVGTSDTASMPAIFYHNSFYVVSNNGLGNVNGGSGTTILRNEFSGAVSTVVNYADFPADDIMTLHHNFDFGKTGILIGITTNEYDESTVAEIDTAGNILQRWDMAQIITAAMVAGGDDPTKFVAASGSFVDWFHNNANAYRASDDTIVISSRENFVIGLDYETGAIKWIIGDPTKQWHEFPSLRKYALTATAGSHYPIGQHAISFYRDNLMLFDNGDDSADHTPKGQQRTYSAPRKYSLDLQARTFTEIWNYVPDPAPYSPIVSSVYEDKTNNYLIDYGVAGPYVFADLIGLNAAGAKVFDYEYNDVNGGTGTAWNAVPIHLENLVFD
jgi:arylsulfate sulfotransferase